MYRLICLDLDGTLLNSKKELTDTNKDALRKASLLGIDIVMCTGRFYNLMPEVIRNLDFTNYAIIINGAQVLDLRNDKVVYDASMSLDTALAIMRFLDGCDGIYDCYLDGASYMTKFKYDKIDEYVKDEQYNIMWKKGRSPVEELKAYISEKKRPIQKIQFIFRDSKDKQYYIEELNKRFPMVKVTSSMPNNVEINDLKANKGIAIRKLAEYIGCSLDEVIGIGDGLNDLDMIKTAGLGIAMANSCKEVLEVANDYTDDCDHDGVAKAIKKHCFK